MSNFGYSDAAAHRQRLAQLRTGRPPSEERSYATSAAPRLPRYAFDPATLIDQSIQAQLHRLYDGPEFDANPVHRYRQEPILTRSAQHRPESRAASRLPSRPVSAATRASDTYDALPREGFAQRRRPASSLPPTPSHRAAFTPPIAIRGTAGRQGGAWSRQQRKEELIENGLEPLQNLVGLDGYFVERLPFSDRQLPSSMRTATKPLPTEHLYMANRNDSACGSRARAVPSVFPQSPAGSLPSAVDRQSTQPLSDLRALGNQKRLTSSPVAAARVEAARHGTASLPHPPTTQQPATQPLSAPTMRSGGGSSSASSSPSTSIASSGSDSTSKEDVFFDEDPLQVPLVSSDPSPSRALRAGMQPPPPSSPSPYTSTTVTAHAVAVECDGSGVPAVAEPKARPNLPLPGYSAGAATVASPSTLSAVAPATAPVGAPAVAARDLTANSVDSTTLDERAPRTPPTIAVELADLARNPRRRSIDALLETLLQLRLQHQRTSHVAAKCPSPARASPSQTNRALHSQGSGVRGRRSFSASRSKSSGPARARHVEKLNTSYESHASGVPDSVYSAHDGVDAQESMDDVYVRLYHRYRRCECCEVPLPRDVVRPKPPPPRPSRMTGAGGQRRGRRPPEAMRPQPALSTVPYEELAHLSNAPPSSTPPVEYTPSRDAAHYFESVDPDEEVDARVRNDYAHAPDSTLAEACQPQRNAAQDPRVSAATINRAVEILTALVDGARQPAEINWAARLQSADGEDDGNSSGTNYSEPYDRDEILRYILQSGFALDEATSAELLHLLCDKAPLSQQMHGYVSAQQLYGSRLPYGSGSAFPRASPYAENELLYPYNIPHRPMRNDSVETAPGASGKTNETTSERNGSASVTEDEQAASTEPPLAEVVAEGAGSGGVEVKSTQSVADPPPSPPHPRAVDSKGVQTSLPSSRRASTGFKNSDAVKPKIEETKLSSKSSSAPYETVAMAEVLPVGPVAIASAEQKPTNEAAQTAVAAQSARGSLSSIASSSLAKSTHSPPRHSSSETLPVSQEVAAVNAVAAEAADQSSPATDAHVQAEILKSVWAAQARLLAEMEETLRRRQEKDQTGVRSDCAIEELRQREAVGRRAVHMAEIKERSHLQRSGRYGRDRMVVMEASLKEWSKALEEERQAYRQLLANAAAEAAAVTARTQAAARLRASIDELLYDEARRRQSIRFTESLVRQELQISVCEYAEDYTRDDLEYVQMVAWLELERAVLADALLIAGSASSLAAQTPTNLSTNASSIDVQSKTSVESSHDGQAAAAENAQSSLEAVLSPAQPTEEGKDDKDKEECRTEGSICPFMTPAMLLSDEEEAAQHTEANKILQEGTSAVPAADCASSASAMSGALVLEPRTETPVLESSQVDRVPSHKSGLVGEILSAAPNCAAEATLLDDSDDGCTRQDNIIVHVVKENILVPVASTIFTDAPEALLVAEMVSPTVEMSPSAEPPVQPAVNDTSSTTGKAPLMLEGEGDEEGRVRVTLPRVFDGLQGTSGEAPLRDATSTAHTNEVYSSRFESDTSVQSTAQPATKDNLTNSQEVPRADETEGGTACETKPAIPLPTSSDARSPPVPPLAAPAVPPSTSLALAPAAEDQFSHLNAESASPSGDEHPPHETNTDSASGSSRASSGYRRRRQRRPMRNRTAMANAIELDEAGEIRGFEDDDAGNADSGFYRASAAPEEQERKSTPPPWREITAAVGSPRTLTFHSGVETREMVEEIHSPEHSDEAQLRHVNSAGSASATLEDMLHDSAQSEKARLSSAVDSRDVPGEAETLQSDDATISEAYAEGPADDSVESPIPVFGTSVTRGHHDTAATTASGFQADNKNFEASMDDRRFLSPLSNRSEVNTPHVRSQDDFSYYTAPASVQLNAAERRRDSGVLSYHDGTSGSRKDAAEHPMTVEGTQPDFTHSPHPQPSTLSLSAYSLSSPHLLDSDGEKGDNDDLRDEEEMQDEVEGPINVDENVEEEHSESSDEAHNPARRCEDATVDDCERRWSSCTGKDEVELMHERVSAMKRAAEEHEASASTPTSERGRARAALMRGSERARVSIDGHTFRVRGRRSSREIADAFASEGNDTDTSSGAGIPTKGYVGNSRLGRDNDTIPGGIADSPPEVFPEDHLTHDELATGAVSRSSLAGSRGSMSVAVSKTQGTYFGSLDSDALTPVTRMVRAQCWEENSAVAPCDVDAGPRPPTPDFVREVLAEQLKHAVPKRGGSGEEGEPTAKARLTNPHLPLPHLDDSIQATHTEARRNSNSSHSTHEEYPFPSYHAKAGASIRDDYSQKRGTTYVKADGDSFETVPQAALLPERVKDRRLGAHAVGPGSTAYEDETRRGTVARSAAPPFSPAMPQRPPFPWEVVADTASVREAATNNELIPLKQSDEDVGNSGAPNRFTRLRVRVPSPHPRVLRRTQETNSEESTSTSAEEDTSGCQSMSANDTRFMTAVPSGSLRSEDLATAQLQRAVRLHLVDSPSDSATVGGNAYSSSR